MDLLLNEEYDLKTENGDFGFGKSFNQEVDLIVRSVPGEWKNQPLIGVDLYGYLLDENIQELKANVKKQMRFDGKKLKQFSIKNGKINIDVE